MSRELIASRLDFAHLDQAGCLVIQHFVNYSTWGEGCAVGRSRADQVVEYMRSEGDTSLLLRVIASQIEAGKEPDAIATGFAQRIAEHLLMMQ